jgi:hypothetical protein
MIKSEDGIKCRGDFFWSVGDFSFEKDTIGHNFTVSRTVSIPFKDIVLIGNLL